MFAIVLRVAACAVACTVAAAAPGAGPFSTDGKRILDADGNWVVLRGFSLSCTEYMARPNMPLDSWPGSYAWNACFAGRENATAPLALNNQTSILLNNYLRPDTLGGPFVTQPHVAKVAWPAPYSEVLSPGSPRVVPFVRIPVTSATYMYDLEANELHASGYRALIRLIVEAFTSQGVAVAIDQHGCCAGGKLNCSSRGGPMALRDYGVQPGATAFWSMVASDYLSNDLVLYELYNEPHVRTGEAWWREGRERRREQAILMPQLTHPSPFALSTGVAAGALRG